jgi:ketosteroid isomerase-like protein
MLMVAIKSKTSNYIYEMLFNKCYVSSNWTESKNIHMISVKKQPTTNASALIGMPRVFRTITCLMLLVLASCSTLQDPQRSRNIAMAEGFFDKVNSADPYTAQDLLHPDFTFMYMSQLPISNVNYNRDTFFTVWLPTVGSLVPKGIVFETVGTIADDHGVALIMTGDAEGINGEYDNAYVFIFKMEDGKIHSIEEYNSDLLTATRLYSNKLVPSN